MQVDFDECGHCFVVYIPIFDASIMKLHHILYYKHVTHWKCGLQMSRSFGFHVFAKLPNHTIYQLFIVSPTLLFCLFLRLWEILQTG